MERLDADRRWLLALDLDGTACNNQSRLGERTKLALTRARELGHVVCFATGRREVDMLSFGDDHKYADYLLMNNGGKLVRTGDGAVLFHERVDPETARALIERCLANDYQLHVLDGFYWALNRWNESLKGYTDQLGTRPVPYHTLEEVPWQHLDGFMATVDLEPVCKIIKEMGLPLLCVLSEPGCVDITPARISKRGGLERLAALLDIPRERTIAAGDYDNDIDMIQWAGVGAAVQNALPRVKAAADYVTPHDNDHDGVADLVAHFFFRGGYAEIIKK